MELKERLAPIGVDYETAMRTFANNSALYEKFLKRLPQDESFAALQKAFAEKSEHEMELHAHTLKGVSGNLRITPLFDACTALVDALRRTHGEEELTELYGKVVQTYEQTIAVLSQL